MHQIKDKSIQSYEKALQETNLDSFLVLCTVCQIEIQLDSVETLFYHRNSDDHIALDTGQKSLIDTKRFQIDLAKVMFTFGIAWTDLKNPIFQDFLQKYCLGQCIPEELSVEIINSVHASRKACDVTEDLKASELSQLPDEIKLEKTECSENPPKNENAAINNNDEVQYQERHNMEVKLLYTPSEESISNTKKFESDLLDLYLDDTERSTILKDEEFKTALLAANEETEYSDNYFGSDINYRSIKLKKKVDRPQKLSHQKSKMKENILDVTHNQKYPCSFCPKKFNSETILKMHVSRHKGIDKHICDICGKGFNKQAGLHHHRVSHTPLQQHNCVTCGKHFIRVGNLRRHEASHSDSSLKCSECPRRFMGASLLRHHLQEHRAPPAGDTKKAACPICHRVLSKKYMKTHMRVHTGERLYPCAVCQKSFNSNSHLKEHHKWHVERPYLCSICGRSFIRNDYLVIHMRRHRGDKPYKCVYCGKGFARSGDLATHERYHTDKKTYLCTVCGKGFHRQYNLTVHQRTHTGEKPYKCEFCTKSFTQSNDLKAHVRRHTGERYYCEVCGEGFIQAYSLAHHKKGVHGIDCASHIQRLQKHSTTESLHITVSTPLDVVAIADELKTDNEAKVEFGVVSNKLEQKKVEVPVDVE